MKLADGGVLCDARQLVVFPAISRIGRELRNLPIIHGILGAQYSLIHTTAATLAISLKGASDPSGDAGRDPIRLGPLAERMLWYIHFQVMKSGCSTLIIADRQLACAIWPDSPSARPAHWRSDLLLILASLTCIHVFDDKQDIIQLEEATALVATAVDQKATHACPESCPEKGCGAHHHFLIRIGGGFLGSLEACSLKSDEPMQGKYDFFDRRVLRRLGRRNRLRRVFLPAKLGSQKKITRLSFEQHRVFQSLIQEVTRAPSGKCPEGTVYETVIGGVIKDFVRDDSFCGLLPANQTFIIFGGNGYRSGLGYLISSPGGWCAKAGFSADRPQDFLRELLRLSTILDLNVIGATRLPCKWLSGDQLLQIASSPNSNKILGQTHLRVYADVECWSKSSSYFVQVIRQILARFFQHLMHGLAKSFCPHPLDHNKGGEIMCLLKIESAIVGTFD
jgi:hypothetical protein